MSTAWPWVTIAFLGAYHGLNPGMGWLFALSLGLQDRSRWAVLRSLLPIALGHAVAVSLTILTVRIAQEAISPRTTKIAVAAALFATGCFALVTPAAGE